MRYFKAHEIAHEEREINKTLHDEVRRGLHLDSFDLEFSDLQERWFEEDMRARVLENAVGVVVCSQPVRACEVERVVLVCVRSRILAKKVGRLYHSASFTNRK